MAPVGEWLRRLQYLVNRGRVDAALREEMEAHRAMMRNPARFGNTLRLREDARDVWGFRWLDDLVRDLQLGARSLRRTPGFTIVAVASLALALAVTTVAAALVNAYVVRSLPYEGADRLHHVMYAPPGPWEPAGLSLLDWTTLEDVVEHAVTAASETMFVGESAETRPSRALLVSQGFVDGLGVRAAAGRALEPEDHLGAGAPAAMISARLWRERFGADPSAVGREFAAEVESRGRSTERFRVVGVLPEGFWFGRDSRDLVDVILPLRTPTRTYRVRLREGVPAELAAARLTEAVRAIATDLPPTWPGVTLESAHERYVGPLRPILRAVAIATGIILAIACANLAVLVLLRALRRHQEIGIRLALGAGRGRIARMLVVEAALLVSLATVAGLWLGALALEALGPTIVEQLGRPAPAGEGALRIDGAVAGAIAALGVLVAAALPLLALLAPWGRRLAESLRRDRRTSTDTSAARHWRGALVSAQIAGSLALLVGAGLMLRSLENMVRADYGIRTDGLVRVGVDFTGRSDADGPAGILGAYDRLVADVAALTGAPVPLFQWPQFAETPKQPVSTDRDREAALDIGVVPVGPPYFSVLRIPLVHGRLFDDTDRLGAEPVAIVSESAARRLWPGADAVGRRILVADNFISGSRERGWRTVVGVVRDVRQTFDDRDTADIYISFLQAPAGRYAWFYVTTTQPARLWEPALRETIADIDSRALVRVAVPLREEAARQWAAPEFLTGLVGALAAFALGLAMLGVYGVTAFSVQQREREFAIRSALGATRGQVARMLLREGSALLGAGLAIGTLAATGVGRALGGQLYDVHPLDPGTFAVALCMLLLFALVAAGVPALRAARRSPASVLSEG